MLRYISQTNINGRTTIILYIILVLFQKGEAGYNFCVKSSVFQRKLQINQKVVHLKFSVSKDKNSNAAKKTSISGIHWILLAVLFCYGDLCSVLGKEALGSVSNYKQCITTTMISFSGVSGSSVNEGHQLNTFHSRL